MYSNNHAEKRARTPNFSATEKQVLLSIIHKYRSVVENKKTDAVSNDDKNEAWDQITREFNTSCPDMRHRTTPCLKKFYSNKKKEIRKEVAVENKEKVLTGGGGVAPLKDIEEKELLLGLMNHKTIYGLHNEFDSDQPLTSILEEYDMEEEIEINATEEAEYVPKRQKMECLTEEPIPSCSGMQSTWKRVTPTILSTPISVPLKSGSFEGQDTPRKVLDSSRRRPTTVIKALTSSAIAEKYDMLLERRLAISNMEAKEIEDRLQWQQKMQQEQLQKIQLEKEKIQLEKESLLLDIALKKEQLRVLKM